jgi:predicted DNA-binding protein YlxM (UPF0122 family)
MPAHRKDEQVSKMYQEYKKGFSLEQVANMFGITRQSVYNVFKRRNYILRAKNQLPYIFHGDRKYTLRNTGYYADTLDERQLLHRVVWEEVNGLIQEGYDIHHIDGDRSNSQLKNLELISHSEHSSVYANHQNQYTKVEV